MNAPSERDRIDRLRAVVARLKACADTTAKDPTHLKEVVARVREAALTEFVAVELPRFRLLDKALSGAGVPLAALSVCGYRTAEVRYTQLLRYFLDPRAAHGLGERVLRAVLTPELEDAEVSLDQLDFEEAKVEADVGVGKVEHGSRSQGCTLDLLITFDDFHVVIEHKITSPETGAMTKGEYPQLARYARAIKANRPDIGLDRCLWIFLTPNRKAPKTDTRWRPVAHGDVVTRCIAILGPELPAVARFNLCCFVWDLLTGPTWWRGGELLDEVRKRVGEVVENPDRSFAMKRWCAAKGIDWIATLKIVEAVPWLSK